MQILNAMTAMHAAALWSGLCILLLALLSFRTIFARRSLKVSFGDGGDALLTSRSRAFGNASEYIPAGMIVLVLMALLGFQSLWIHVVGGTLLLGRLLHAWGLSQTKQPSFGRVFGMVLTQLALIGGAGALITCAWGFRF